MEKPVLGIVMGDPSGVGPELVAKLASAGFFENVCKPILIGDERVLKKALGDIGANAQVVVIDDVSKADWSMGLPMIDTKDQNPDEIEPGKASKKNGEAILNMLETACGLCESGSLSGFVFAPLNKTSIKMAMPDFESEQYIFARRFGVDGPFGELNVVGDMMSVRATSHIPIKDVSAHLTIERVLQAIELGYITVKSTGVKNPRLGVAALNPHCGEGGRCGREEIDVIEPAIALANERGWGAVGPFSSDILFIKAFNGDFDAVVTMYHDQGQIALKLKGFDQGVTVAGGQPYPIATCAHGTAYDIVGKGIARTTALESAVRLTSKMAQGDKA